MSESLDVCHGSSIVGVLTELASGRMRFEYDDAWRDSPAAFPISLSLPLHGSLSESAGHHFFANLLPEGSVREQICQSLKISTDNDFGLLRAIGGAWDPNQVSTKHLERLAADFAFRASVVVEQTGLLIEKLLDRIPATCEKFAAQFGDSPMLERLPILIRKSIRRAKSQRK